MLLHQLRRISEVVPIANVDLAVASLLQEEVTAELPVAYQEAGEHGEDRDEKRSSRAHLFVTF